MKHHVIHGKILEFIVVRELGTKRTELGGEVDRNQNIKTVQSMLRTKSLSVGSEELVECFWSRESYAQIIVGV